jgi:hypothetical protein
MIFGMLGDATVLPGIIHERILILYISSSSFAEKKESEKRRKVCHLGGTRRSATSAVTG